MNITLTRPLVCFDIEATGKDPQNDRIVELSLIKIFPDGTRKTATSRLNPTIPIPPASTEVHGITDEDVKDCKTFAQVAEGIHKFIQGCDTLTYNGLYYDLRMLYFEFLRADITWNYNEHLHVDAGNIFKINEQRTLTAAVKFYCDRDHDDAHGAEADTVATIDVFSAQIEKYPEMPKTLPELAKYSNHDKEILDLSGKFTLNDNNEICYNFGKYPGERVVDHIDYLDWMLHKASFNPDTVAIGQKIWDEYFAPQQTLNI